MTTRLVCSLFWISAVIACASGGDEPPSEGMGAGAAMQLPGDVECGADTPTFAEVSAFGKCATCHDSTKTGAARSYAPAHINFDSEIAADPMALRAVSAVMTGTMPPRASGLTLSEVEKQQLYTWAMCSM